MTDFEIIEKIRSETDLSSLRQLILLLPALQDRHLALSVAVIYAQHSDPILRQNSVLVLGQLRDPTATPRLVEFLGSELDKAVCLSSDPGQEISSTVDYTFISECIIAIRQCGLTRDVLVLKQHVLRPGGFESLPRGLRQQIQRLIEDASPTAWEMPHYQKTTNTAPDEQSAPATPVTPPETPQQPQTAVSPTSPRLGKALIAGVAVCIVLILLIAGAAFVIKANRDSMTVYHTAPTTVPTEAPDPTIVPTPTPKPVQYGEVSGFVLDGAGAGVADATVACSGMNVLVSAVTDSDGHYLLSQIPYSTYNLSISTREGSGLANRNVVVNASVAEANLSTTGAPIVKEQMLPLVNHSYELVTLHENLAASNVTWGELQSFLQADDTDQQPYLDPTFVCTEFALRLHDSAEGQGIKCGYVTFFYAENRSLDPQWSLGADSDAGLPEGKGHALCIFNTTDRGLVYVDDTNDKKSSSWILLGPALRERGFTVPENAGCDKIGYLAAGEEYGALPLDLATGFDYATYQAVRDQYLAYAARCVDYCEDVETYNARMATHNAKVDDYNYRNIGVYSTLKNEEFQLSMEKYRLNQEKKDLEAAPEADWNIYYPLGAAGEIQVYW